MDGLQRSDAKPENANDHDDEEIIDLTQIVGGDDEDEIIELTNILEQPGKASETTDDDDAPIPLVDIAQPETAAEAADADEAEPIDLTDIALQPDSAAVDSEPSADEEIIDLAGMETSLESDIGEPEAEPFDLPPVDDAGTDELGDAAEEVVDLLDVADLAQPETTPADTFIAEPMEPIDLSGDDDDTPDMTDDDIMPPPAETIIEALVPPDMSAGAAPELPEIGAPVAAAFTPERDAAPGGPVPPAPEAPTLTDEQLTAALERVIEKVYGDRIEELLMATIEKTVRREIQKIKSTLMTDDEQMPD